MDFFVFAMQLCQWSGSITQSEILLSSMLKVSSKEFLQISFIVVMV